MHGKHHLSLGKLSWENGQLSRKYNDAWAGLKVEQIKNPTWNDFERLVGQIKTGVDWASLEAHKENIISDILTHPETKLLLLKQNGKEVGYSFIVPIKPELKNRFWSASQNKKVIEIANLALFDGQRGNGIGKSFFEMIFKELFNKYDTVYWGTSDFNADSLVKFYTDKLGMEILDYDSPKKQMSLVPKNHWGLTDTQYKRGLLSDVYNNTWPDNLRLKPIAPTYENLEPMMAKMSELWHWKDQERYNEDALRRKLAQPGTVLYSLRDSFESEPKIGYALVSKPPQSLVRRFWPAANDVKVLEVDNLGLFPGNEGGGRGNVFFEKIFDRHYAYNNIIYWSQHETHSPTLTRFYEEKLKMELLAIDQVPDFRSAHQFEAAQELHSTTTPDENSGIPTPAINHA